MNREERRGPWYLITALILGAALGLAYAWIISPVEYIDTSPASLRTDYKDQYRVLVASAYAANNDLARARARLQLLGEPEVERELTLQAQRALAEGRPATETNNLGVLALALGQGLVSSPPSAPTQAPLITNAELTQTQAAIAAAATLAAQGLEATPTLTYTLQTTPATRTPSAPQATPTRGVTPTPTPRIAAPNYTPLPTRTPTATAGAPFVLKQDVALVCNPLRTTPMIMIEAQDASGNPVPGLQVLVQWAGGEDRFFTGLKPDLGLGFADFAMTPGVTYTVQLAVGGQPVTDLTPTECENASKERYLGSWRLIFIQP